MAGIDDDEKLRAEAEIRRKIGAWMEDQASRPPPTRSDYRRLWWRNAARTIGRGTFEIIKVVASLLLLWSVLITCSEMQDDAPPDIWESGYEGR